MDWMVISRNYQFLLGGLKLTAVLAFLGMTGGFLVGVTIGLGRLSPRRWIFVPCTLYVNLFRSLPIVLVVFWFYFLVPIITGRPIGGFLSVLIAFIVFEGAYFAEIVRGGIQSVPKGQVEAGYASGLNYLQVMRYVVLPQALKNMLPPIVTQCVIIFQDTSVAYVIGLKEFMRRVTLVDMREFRSVELYTFAAVVYLLLCSAGVAMSRWLEKKTAAV
ncbi:amino acid ABC transporter permease [uncultured Desulfosarcina sp.]|uniref:amino acid ABC transporter permease n=1 Tax=uncultured Desulfosarcina sp. TaxID=218289 RepID=UPI0029C765A9|nr:amino acid ABC transporter permease [uncultured Desulfosarcina sp.]